MLRLVLVALLLGFSAEALAQSRPERNGPPRPTKAAVAAELARIDSAGDASQSIDARMRIAELLKGKEALILLQDAAVRADSVQDRWRSSEARTKLVDRYRASGDNKRALAEALRIIESERQGRALESEQEAGEVADLIQAHQHELDSLIAVHEQSALASSNELGHARKAIAQREVIIIVVAAIGIVLLLFAILLLRRSHRRAMDKLRKEVNGSQARISALAQDMQRMARQMEEQRAVPQAIPASEAPTHVVEKEAPAHDPMVLALFKRQAPERIAALHAARAAGNHEKVLRVLHSLRPQLDALEPDGLGASCARLRDMQPSDSGWHAGLEELMAGISALLARS